MGSRRFARSHLGLFLHYCCGTRSDRRLIDRLIIDVSREEQTDPVGGQRRTLDDRLIDRLIIDVSREEQTDPVGHLCALTDRGARSILPRASWPPKIIPNACGELLALARLISADIPLHICIAGINQEDVAAKGFANCRIAGGERRGGTISKIPIETQ